jgi:hypothetical protein
MAISRRFEIPFEVAFPEGLYLISEVERVPDFDKSTQENKVQQVDPDSGLPLWQVICLDLDPEAKKAQKTVTVKIPAKVQPVPPENRDGSPITPVMFEGLTALPWIEESGSFSKISWSFRANAIVAPGKAAGRPASGDKAAA